MDPVTQCSICHELIQADQTMTRTKCGHFFHYRCLKKWKRSRQAMSHTCPECRTEISKKRKHSEDHDLYIVQYLNDSVFQYGSSSVFCLFWDFDVNVIQVREA